MNDDVVLPQKWKNALRKCKKFTFQKMYIFNYGLIYFANLSKYDRQINI